MPEMGARNTERKMKLNGKRRKDCTKNPNVYDMITFMPFCKIMLVSRNAKRKTFKM